ncbi:MAG: SRPBCC family protein, partial [Solirubrobacterales bacterium]
MSRSVSATIFLAVAPERVWETVMDPTRLRRWVTTHDSVAGATPGPAREGDSFTQKLRLAGKSFEVDWKVVEADQPHLARWEGEGPVGSRALVSYRLETEDGGTRFDYRSELALPGGALGKVAGGLLAAAPGKR